MHAGYNKLYNSMGKPLYFNGLRLRFKELVNGDQNKFLKIKKLFRDTHDIGEEELEDIEDVEQLWTLLVSKDVISMDNVRELKDLALELQDERLKQIVKDYESRTKDVGERVLRAVELCLKVGVRIVFEKFLLKYTRNRNNRRYLERNVLPRFISLLDVSEGCLCFVVETSNLASLKQLWTNYKDGSLTEKLKKAINEIDEVRELSDGTEIDVTVTMDEEEYREACWVLVRSRNTQDQGQPHSHQKQRRHSLSCQRELPALGLVKPNLKWQELMILNEAKNNIGQTALFCAVQGGGNESVVRALIDVGADVNLTDNTGRTALFCAVQQSNNESVARAMIGAGADVNVTDNTGRTALFYAVQQNNNKSVVRALIDVGTDVNITDDIGQTALFIAVQQSDNKSMVRALIDAGADVNITDNIGRTAFFYAVQQSNNESVVRALIDAGADVNITDNIGRTAFFYAVQQSNNESVVRALIDAGADVNTTDDIGQTALFNAVQQSNNESVVHLMIDAGGAFVNVRDVYGRTPLFYALDYPKSARILVDKGQKQNLHKKDNCNCSILAFFVERRLFHGVIDDTLSQNIPSGFFDLLEECGVQKIKFAEAILNMVFCKFPLMFLKRSKIELMQKYDLSFSYCGQTLVTHITKALELASKYIDDKRYCELIGLLNEKCTNGEAVSEALQLLVELGADPNSVDSDGNTALHYATGLALMGVPQEIVMEICLQLERLGVQFNLRNHENQTPLLFCLSGDIRDLYEDIQISSVKTVVEACRFLSKHGSRFEERSGSGESVFHSLFKLFQGVLKVNEETLRQDILHEAINILPLFSPAKVTQVVNQVDADLKSPLHLWASLELPSPKDYSSNVTKDLTFEEFLQTTLTYLLKCGAMLNARNRYDQTPLHFCKTWIAMKLLLDAGAKANNLDSSEASPLVAAAKERWLFSDYQGGLYPDVSELEDPKSFWKTAMYKGLDLWTADEEGESVLSVLIEHENFALAKALVDVACEEGHTQSEEFAVGLLNAICKDKSTRTNWKITLVQDILKSRRGPTTASEPLRLCCKNILETGALNNKVEKKSPSAANEMYMSASEDHEIFDDGQPQSKKRRMDTSLHLTQEEFKTSSVHCEIIKILRLYGSDGSSCLDMTDTSDALKELLAKPLDLSTVSVLIPWTSISKKYEVKLAKVARRQECCVIHEEFWCHKEHIGSGSYGDVFVGINEKDGREVAIKRIVKLRMQQQEDKREIANLAALADCEQIVRYLHFFEEEKFSYIFLELMEGNLDEYLTDGSTFDARKSTQLCQDVVKGLTFMHAQDIIHCDLKPGNILYKTHPYLRLKIAHFALSRRVDSSATTVYDTYAGTRCWMAPEVLMGTHDHSKASDMFSCGLVLHYILSVQKHPFSKNNSQMAHQIEANIINGRIEGWDDSLSPEANHLVKNMLGTNEKVRPTAREALDHPLFWSNEKKVDLLVAVGNQSLFGYPRARRSTRLTAVETDLENNFSTIVVHGKWNDPRYKDMPLIYAEMTPPRRSYDIHSVVELVRFIRNAYAQVSEATRPTTIRKMLLEDFVFLEYFPHLVMEVYKVVTDHGLDQIVEEIKYAMNK